MAGVKHTVSIGLQESLAAGLELYGTDGIRLGDTQFSDNFNDNSIDTAKWNEYDEGTNITEQNQRMEGRGNDSDYSSNGIISDDSHALIDTMEWKFTLTPPSVADQGHMLIGPSASSSLSSAGQMATLLLYAASFEARINGNSTATGYDFVATRTYNVRIVYTDPGWEYYIQSDDDANYSTEIKIYDTATDSTGPMYFHYNCRNSNISYLDDVSVEYYLTSSPATIAGWTALDKGELDVSTALCVVYKDGYEDGEVQAESSTDVKVRYYANGGGPSAWMTIAAFKAESDITITDTTSSFKMEAQYNSDGTYQSASRAQVMIDFTPAAANGGGEGNPFINVGGYFGCGA